MNALQIILLAAGALVTGAVLGYFFAAARRTAETRSLAEDRARAAQEASRIPELQAKLDKLAAENADLLARIAGLSQRQEAEKEKSLWLDKAQEQLREAFQALAANALRSNSEEFTNRTREQLVAPLEKSLKGLDDQVREMEKKREGAYKGLDQHLAHLREAYDHLRDTTSDLSTALTTSSGARGDWGEIQMRRVVELAGMVEHVDFDEQQRIESGQPDMVIHLPNRGILPVDAKTTMKTYLDAMKAEDDSTRKTLLRAHAGAVKSRVRELSGKEYWRQFKSAPDFIVMFLPNEAFLSGAFEGDRDLFEYALGQRILIATPVTLLALLRTVAFGWQQQHMAENARDIALQARELSTRITTFITHLQKTGKGLNSAVKAYNDAVGSLQSRVMPSVRRFKELGVASTDAPAMPPIDTQATLPPLEAE
jgi:DNA recombination protein RmuC